MTPDPGHLKHIVDDYYANEDTKIIEHLIKQRDIEGIFEGCTKKIYEKDYAFAVENLRKIIDLISDKTPNILNARIYSHLGHAQYYLTENHDGVKESFEHAIDYAQQVKRTEGWVQAARASYNLGIVLAKDSPNDAINAYSQSVNFFNRLDLPITHFDTRFYRGISGILAWVKQPEFRQTTNVKTECSSRAQNITGYTGLFPEFKWEIKLENREKQWIIDELSSFTDTDHANPADYDILKYATPFYPDFTLHDTKRGNGLYSYYLYAGGTQKIQCAIMPLEGTSNSIHFINAIGLLYLNTQTAIDYLCFFANLFEVTKEDF